MRLKEKLKRLTLRSWSVSFDYRLMKLKQLIIGWVNYFRIAQMKTVCGNLDKTIRFRLRMCIWKQWKKIKTKYKSLMKLVSKKIRCGNGQTPEKDMRESLAHLFYAEPSQMKD